MPELKPISQKQWLGRVEGLPAFRVTSFTAPTETFDTTEYSDGQTGQVLKHQGALMVGDVTLKAVFDPVEAKSVASWWEAQKKARKVLSISLVPCEADLAGTPISGALTLTLTGCQVSSWKWPEGNRTGNAIAELEIVVQPREIKTA